MVKVLPSTFTLFANQGIFSLPQEPLCIHCSEEYVFAACEERQIVVYSLFTQQMVAKLRTIWPVSELVYSSKGDCIVTIERRDDDFLATSRIYLKWRDAKEERPARVASLPDPSVRQVDVEIIELPVGNVSCISACDLTGVIAVGSLKTVHVFVLKIARSAQGATIPAEEVKVSAFMDIKMDIRLKKIDICGNYIACISNHRVRVIKLHILGSSAHPWMQFYQPTDKENDLGKMGKGLSKDNGCPEDKHFVMWSPSLVWEEEGVRITSRRRQAKSVAMTTAGAGRVESLSHGSQGSGGVAAGDADRAASDPELVCSQAHEWIHEGEVAQMDDPKLIVQTVTLPMVVQSINQSRSELDKHELEVLGPVEYVWGQSLSTQLHREAGKNVKCHVLTMLFRRFPSSGYVYVPTEVRSHSLTLATAEATRLKGRYLHGRRPKKKGGLHSVQLSPTLCEGVLDVCIC